MLKLYKFQLLRDEVIKILADMPFKLSILCLFIATLKVANRKHICIFFSYILNQCP